eukprot:PhF_6_TR30765/c0_g1_i3/m.45314/K07936/RAN; GTP-binding nuclear protein Ran
MSTSANFWTNMDPQIQQAFLVASHGMHTTASTSSLFSVPYHLMEHDLLPFLSVQHRYSIVIVGDSGVGKTTFVRQHKDAKNESTTFYHSTIGSEVHRLGFDTSTQGHCELMVRDTCGQEKFGPLRDAYYQGNQGAIIMYDVTSRISYKNVPLWYRELMRVCDGIPIVLCGNKVDDLDRKIRPKVVTFHRKKNLKHVDVSAKGLYRCDVPYLELLRKLTNDPTLVFTASIHRDPPLIAIPIERITALEAEWEQIESYYRCVLDEDDDEL